MTDFKEDTSVGTGSVAPASRPIPSADGLEQRITAIGRDLSGCLDRVLEEIPDGAAGPQALASTLGLDKVLASRVLKAARSRDPLAFVHRVPGPDPLRRLLRAARRAGASPETVRAAESAVARYERLIRQEVGDRSGLDAIISAWLPEARREFELRRKQAAFRALSQLKGAMAQTSLATVALHPAEDGEHIDILWIFGLLGLQRLRPGVNVKFATRRLAGDGSPRRPLTLDRLPLEDVADARLDQFCDAPPAAVGVEQVGEVVHYVLSGEGYGPRAAADLVMAEVNLAEIPRYVPVELGRKGNVFAEIGTPTKTLLFDVLVHESIYPGSEPSLLLYDTALDGVADVNDRSRDIDRLDLLLEQIQPLGRGAAALRLARIPRYVEMVRHAFTAKPLEHCVQITTRNFGDTM